jgi:hypothetical protein
VLCRLALLFALTACQIAPRLPTTTLPSTPGNHLTLGVGVTTTFDATLTEDGTTRDVVPTQTETLAIVEIPTVGFWRPINSQCDAGGQLGVGQLGARARCGVVSGTAGAAIATGVHWQWWGGIVGHAEVQLGFAKAGWFAFVTSGAAFGVLRHKIPLGDYDPLYFSGPPDPSVVIDQREIAWTTTTAIGFPVGRGGIERMPSAFLGFTYDRPLATSTPGFSCRGCTGPHAFQDFTPGWRLGVLVGVTGSL